MIISIDPGKRSLAWASWVGGELTSCRIERHKSDPWEAWIGQLVMSVKAWLPCDPAKVVVELPRIYPHDRTKNPNDLIDLAAVAGACSALGPLEFVHPATWKGQVPKEICHARMKDKLSGKERVLLVNDHNVLDAVGIGLWYLERHGLRHGST